MGFHEQTDIHRASYTLFVLVVKFVRSYPVDLKRLLGEKLRDECLEILVDIREANIARNKAPHLDQLLRRLERANMLLRTSDELKCISHGQYGQAIELTTNVAKQAHGWKKRFPAPSPAA